MTYIVVVYSMTSYVANSRTFLLSAKAWSQVDRCQVTRTVDVDIFSLFLSLLVLVYFHRLKCTRLMMHTSSRALIIIVLTLFITPSTERNFEKIVGGGGATRKNDGTCCHGIGFEMLWRFFVTSKQASIRPCRENWEANYKRNKVEK